MMSQHEREAVTRDQNGRQQKWCRDTKLSKGRKIQVMTYNRGRDTESIKRKDHQVATRKCGHDTNTWRPRESCRDGDQIGLQQKRCFFVATHNSTKEERARSQYGIMVVAQIPRNKKMWSQQESSPLATQQGRDKEFMSRPLTKENCREQSHDKESRSQLEQ